MPEETLPSDLASYDPRYAIWVYAGSLCKITASCDESDIPRPHVDDLKPFENAEVPDFSNNPLADRRDLTGDYIISAHHLSNLGKRLGIREEYTEILLVEDAL